jgi:hypothetical protein
VSTTVHRVFLPAATRSVSLAHPTSSLEVEVEVERTIRNSKLELGLDQTSPRKAAANCDFEQSSDFNFNFEYRIQAR